MMYLNFPGRSTSVCLLYRCRARLQDTIVLTFILLCACIIHLSAPLAVEREKSLRYVSPLDDDTYFTGKEYSHPHKIFNVKHYHSIVCFPRTLCKS
jgi:hypothetical protein